ncbi:MAG: GDSL-type esterase/lipase family protein [Fibromonadaceae bacterium]|jgi:acyl-CoA thioesterase-1|nr:GDSL-type esterase/lipase family protein [Fibromonadaceae bacterium]
MKFKKYLIVAAAVLFLFGCSSTDDGPKKQAKIVCFGNSLTEGYGAGTGFPPIDTSKSYPHYLAEKVKVPVINLGINGETTADTVERIDDVLSHDPTVVFIEFGANDLIDQVIGSWLGGDIDPNFVDKAKKNFETILDKLADGDRQIYLIKFYNEEVAREIITKYLSEQDMYIYDQYEAMFSSLKNKYKKVSLIENMWDGIWGNSELMYADDIYEIHPNAAGYKIMADNIFKAFSTTSAIGTISISF